MAHQASTLPLQQVIASLPNFVVWKDTNLRYLGCNENLAKALGLASPHELLGKTEDQVGYSQSRTHSLSYDQEVLKSGQPIYSIEEVLLFPNGTIADVISDRVPLFDQQNEVVGVLITSVISSRHHLTDRIFLRHILEQLPYYIFWKSKDSIYLGCNNNFAQLIGMRDLSEVVGKTDYQLSWGEGEAESFRLADQHVMAGHSQINAEETLLRPDGQHITMLVSKVAVHNKHGDTIGMLGISTDITKIKQTEIELREAKRKAEVANVAKGQFLATISHELRTPLNAILGMAQAMAGRKLSAKTRECAEIIGHSSQHLLTLINDILDFAKLEAGKLRVYPEPIDFYELIQEITTTLRHNAELKGLKLDFDYDDKAPHVVMADSKRIRQILVNLIGNSTKFTTQGTITVRVELVELKFKMARIKITVQDTGMGIAADKLDFIFERFSQVESKYNRRFEGSGLGLAICKQLVEAMNGKMGVYSTPGKGSSFWLDIPFLTADLQEKHVTEQAKISKVTELTADHRMLLIEDNLLNQRVAQVMFEQYPCKLDIAHNGEQGLKMLTKHHYHLIFTDIGLPDIDGITVIQRIRALDNEYAKIPIIAMTAHVMQEDIAAFIAAGANDVITKPIMQGRLREVIIQYLSIATSDVDTR